MTLFGHRPVATPPAQDPGDYQWRAARELAEAHAFPPSERAAFRAACGVRWTAAYGHDGATKCLACIVRLRDDLRAINVALAAAGIRTDIPVRAELDAYERRPGLTDYDAPIGAGEDVEASRG